MNNIHSFQPNWASPPGDTIMDILLERDISKNCFADRIGLDIELAEALLNGSHEITEYIASKLSSLLGVDKYFWLNREQQYREDLARIQRAVTPQESAWLSDIPVASMQSFGWIPAASSISKKLLHCLDFFGVPDVSTWNARAAEEYGLAKFRTSPTFANKLGSASAWIRKGELDAEKIQCGNWNKDAFHQSLKSIRSLTNETSPSVFIPLLKNLCAENGVAVVIARTPQGCPASGATKFVSANKALLLLSFRYLSDDHFWFTFFHEAAHLILHEGSTFIELDESACDKHESEANKFASDILIPPQHELDICTISKDYRGIIKFSRKLGVSPGVVLGQLQHRKIVKSNHMNKLKVRYSWSDLDI